MNVLVGIAQFVVNEILAVPAYLIGIITAVGLIALRKSMGQVIGGALKATLGFLLIGAGATLVVASPKPLGVMIQGAAGTKGRGAHQRSHRRHRAEQIRRTGGLADDPGLRDQPAARTVHAVALRVPDRASHPVHGTLLTIVLASAGLPSATVVILGGFLLGVVMVSLPAISAVDQTNHR